MKVYHTCGSWDLSPFVGCINFHYCYYINIFGFIYWPQISVVVLFLLASLFSNILKIFTDFIIFFVILY